MHLGFLWYGLAVFALPMLINIIYVLLPPKIGKAEPNGKYPFFEGTEQVTRILYLITLCILVSNREVSFSSAFFFLSLLFLALYYICWLRYFLGGRNLDKIHKPFLFIPQPLAVFPVLYFLFAALWIRNYIAFAVMIVFGIAHNVVTYKNRRV